MKLAVRLFVSLLGLGLVACGGRGGHRRQQQQPQSITCSELCTAQLQECGTPTNQCHDYCATLDQETIDCLGVAGCDSAAWDACLGGPIEAPNECQPSKTCDGKTAIVVTCNGIAKTTKTTTCASNQTCQNGACVTNACIELSELGCTPSSGTLECCAGSCFNEADGNSYCVKDTGAKCTRNEECRGYVSSKNSDKGYRCNFGTCEYVW